MNKKFIIFGLLFLFLGTSTLAITDDTPANSLLNPVTKALYVVNNSSSQIKVYLQWLSANRNFWEERATIALPSGAKCYGMAASFDGTKLYVSINAGSSSAVRSYSLDSNGVPTGSYSSMTGVSWGSTSSPKGTALAEDGKLYVVDNGRIRVFDTSTNSWIRNITQEAAGKTTLYDVAVTPGSSSYKIYVSNRGSSGEVLVYQNNAGTISYLRKITGLVYPTYLKVIGGKLYVANNGSDGVAVKVYNTSNETWVGNVSTPITQAYGWNAFDVDEANTYLFIKKAKNSTETQNGVYYIRTSAIRGNVTAQEISASTLFPAGHPDSTVEKSDSIKVFAYNPGSDTFWKGALTNSLNGNIQGINLWFPGIKYVIVLSPNGGETFRAGDVILIKWDHSTGTISSVKVEYSTDGGSTWREIYRTTPPTQESSYAWSIPSTINSTQCRIRVSDTADGNTFDISDRNFSILRGSTGIITVESPNGGEVWQARTSHDIRWTSTGSIANVKIEYNLNSGLGSWTTIVNSTPNDGSYSWLIPNVSSPFSRIRISDAANPDTLDTSDHNFTITTISLPDTTSPAAINTLSAAVGDNAGEIKLSWTAVGDDGATGTASRYIVKYSYSGPITTEAQFNSATTYMQSWVPKTAGQVENYTLTGLTPGEQIWVSIKAQDEASNIGPLGNCAATIVKNFVPAPVITKVYPQVGPQGQVNHIVIIGENLYNDMTATIGGNPLLNVHQDSPTMVQADIPDTVPVGTYEITITCPGGTYDDAAHTNPNNDFTIITAGSDTTAPTTVANFSASDSEDAQSTLTWTNPADPDLREVIVLRKEGSYPTGHADAAATQVYQTMIPEPGATVRYIDTGLTNGTTYYYAVFSRDTSNNWNDTVTAGSNADTATPGGGISPNAPRNLRLTKSGNDAILTWDAPEAGEPGGGYRVYRGTSPDTITTQIGSDIPTGTHTLTDPGAVSSSDPYYYVVKAFTGVTESDPSNMVFLYKSSLIPDATTGNNIFWISIPYLNNYTDAQSIVDEINTGKTPGEDGTCVEIGRWDTASGTYQTLSYLEGLGWSGSNFSVVTGESYYIAIRGNTTWSAGYAHDPNFSFDLAHPNGTNIYWISLPYNADYANAQAIADDINTFSANTVVEIGRFSSSGAYESLAFLEGLGWSGTNFAFTPGEGYYISINSPLSGWKPKVR